jgi:hypothetical protein
MTLVMIPTTIQTFSKASVFQCLSLSVIITSVLGTFSVFICEFLASTAPQQNMVVTAILLHSIYIMDSQDGGGELEGHSVELIIINKVVN